MLDQKFLIQIADLFSSLFNFSFDILFSRRKFLERNFFAGQAEKVFFVKFAKFIFIWLEEKKFIESRPSNPIESVKFECGVFKLILLSLKFKL